MKCLKSSIWKSKAMPLEKVEAEASFKDKISPNGLLLPTKISLYKTLFVESVEWKHISVKEIGRENREEETDNGMCLLLSSILFLLVSFSIQNIWFLLSFSLYVQSMCFSFFFFVWMMMERVGGGEPRVEMDVCVCVFCLNDESSCEADSVA